MIKTNRNRLQKGTPTADALWLVMPTLLRNALPVQPLSCCRGCLKWLMLQLCWPSNVISGAAWYIMPTMELAIHAAATTFSSITTMVQRVKNFLVCALCYYRWAEPSGSNIVARVALNMVYKLRRQLLGGYGVRIWVRHKCRDLGGGLPGIPPWIFPSALRSTKGGHLSIN